MDRQDKFTILMAAPLGFDETQLVTAMRRYLSLAIYSFPVNPKPQRLMRPEIILDSLIEAFGSLERPKIEKGLGITMILQVGGGFGKLFEPPPDRVSGRVTLLQGVA